MSGTVPPPQSAAQRFAVAATGRNLAIPRILLVFVGLGALVASGVVVNGVVQHFVNPPPPGPEAAPPNQIRVGAPAALAMPQDTTAPAREAPRPTPPPQPTTASAPPAPKETAAQAISRAAGVESVRPILMMPDKDWDKIGTNPTGQAARSPSDQPTPADIASVAFGARPKPTKLEGNKATAVRDLTRTIRPGTRLSCTTQEAIDTSTGAGDFVCSVDRWVQAWDGMTPLIPPQSWVMVHYEELKSGSNRILAVGGVLTSPDGLVMDLGDPFSMPDGSPGVEGVIQDNTWARLKEGLILDAAQSAFQTVENLASRSNQGNGNSNFNFNMSTNNTQQAVNRALEKNMAIHDILRLPEGAHLSLTIRKPAFFQDVISFQMRAGAR